MFSLATILDQLTGLSRVSWSDPRAALGWRWPLPPWGWALIVLAAAAVGYWSYRRLLGPSKARLALASLRAALVLALAALLVGPMLVVNQEITEPDVLLVLVDQSASMEIRDMPGPAGAAPISRRQALEAALQEHAELFGPQKLGHERKILWLGFAGNTFEIDPFAASAPPPDAQRQTTALRTAIEQALQRATGQRVSGMVIMSDGRSPQSASAALIHRLQRRLINVFAVPLGAESPTLNLAIAQVDAPEKAFINDDVPVTVWLDRYPDNARVDPQRVTVRLVDAQTGKTLDEKHASDDQLRQPVRLTARSAAVGPVPWRVELLDEQAAAGAEQPHAEFPQVLLTHKDENVATELVDQPIGVLYVEGYPRWEFRYLKNMLVREKSLKSSTLLLSADHAFAQEGQLPITRLPNSAEELKPYDVIVIGDVAAGYFSQEQLRLLAEHVAARGAGLLWIGGSNDTPRSYEGTALAGLLPMRSPSSVNRLDPSLGAVTLKPTAQAEALQVFHLHAGGAGEARETAWPKALPPLAWAQNLGELKSSAEVLAASEPIAGRAYPLVTRLRYGAGQALYVGTDETWRWRFGRGDLYFEQFWMQLIRLLGRARLEQGAGRATLEISSRRLEQDQTALVSLHIRDEMLSQRELPRISVAVVRAEAEATPGKDAAVEKIELLPVPNGDEKRGQGVVYQAPWRPSVSGKLTLRLAEPALEDLNLSRSVEVVRADDELRQPAPDRAKLASLAEQTGGQVLGLDQLEQLMRIPSRPQRTPNDIREPLWNSYLALLLIAALLTAEWIGRKAIRLV